MEQGFKQAMNNFSLEIEQNFLQPEEWWFGTDIY